MNKKNKLFGKENKDMVKWKLYCTKTAKTYYVTAKSLYSAVRKLALQLGVSASCIEVPAD